MPVTVQILQGGIKDPKDGGVWERLTVGGNNQYRISYSPDAASVTSSIFTKDGFWFGPVMFSIGAPGTLTVDVPGLATGEIVSITATAWDGTDVATDRISKTRVIDPPGPPSPPVARAAMVVGGKVSDTAAYRDSKKGSMKAPVEGGKVTKKAKR